MFAFHMMSQNARPKLFPATRAKGIGTLLMFVVRNIFSQPDYLRRVVIELINQGELDPRVVERDDPLGFLVKDNVASSVVDAAYRFARHEPGADVVLFGTGSIEHLESNITSILRPPLPANVVNDLYERFGHLVNIGLDAPTRKPSPMA